MQDKTRVIILANKYPNFLEPNINVFTQQITWAFAEQNCECIVICPVAINYSISNIKFPNKRIEITESGRKIQIYHPKYLGLGQNNKWLLKKRVAATTYAYILAADKILKKVISKNCFIFAEFLCPCGVAASILGGKYHIPSYMQCGEATYQGDIRYGNEVLKEKWLHDLSGVIALSTQNKNYLVHAGIIDTDKIIVLPSGYRKDRIYQRDKFAARKRLNLPLNKFIVGFCGSYDDRKGILRLEKAIDEIQDTDIVLAAVGKGNFEPTSSKCVLKGPVNHVDLAWFYSAIDVFAFPTYHEGCCTAIVEAIACGCPVISSDRPFNYEICDHTNSILIEPDDIGAMKRSILKLKNDEKLRHQLSRGSLRRAKELSLDEKAKKILDFVGSRGA